MNPNSIGLDSYLSRELNRYLDEQEEAERLGMQTVTMRVRLSRLRKSLGELLREEVAQTVSSPEDVEQELRELLEALQGVVKFPVRIKCATLSWNTLAQGLDEAGAPA